MSDEPFLWTNTEYEGGAQTNWLFSGLIAQGQYVDCCRIKYRYSSFEDPFLSVLHTYDPCQLSSCYLPTCITYYNTSNGSLLLKVPDYNNDTFVRFPTLKPCYYTGYDLDNLPQYHTATNIHNFTDHVFYPYCCDRQYVLEYDLSGKLGYVTYSPPGSEYPIFQNLPVINDYTECIKAIWVYNYYDTGSYTLTRHPINNRVYA